jgi:hypothetical protein
MEIPERKTLEDFPKFVVADVRRGPMSENGYHSFELEGRFDSIHEGGCDEIIEEIGSDWFWLLFGRRGFLRPMVKSFDKETGTAILDCLEDEEPNGVGRELAYLSPRWQAFHVWMVFDPAWRWERKQFQGIDAVAEDYEAKDASIIDGREVRVWTRMEPTGAGRGQSRHYPAADQALPVRTGTRLISGGWDHEHCELCNEHIDAAMFGYCDLSGHWMCEKCYERYVVPHDLAFVDGL